MLARCVFVSQSGESPRAALAGVVALSAPLADDPWMQAHNTYAKHRFTQTYDAHYKALNILKTYSITISHGSRLYKTNSRS